MNSFLKRILQGDTVFWCLFIGFFIISMIWMYSASSYLVARSGSINGPIIRHAMFYIIGFGCILIIQRIPFKWIRFFGYVGLAFSLFLLIYTLLFGVEQHGAARFIAMGSLQFQPSEFAKISLIIVMADQIERFNDPNNPNYESKAYWYIVALIYATCFFIFLENLSTAVLLFGVIIAMMIIGGVKWKRWLSTVAIVVAFIAVILAGAMIIPPETLHKYKALALFDRAYTWVARIETDVTQNSDPESKYVITDKNYQESHAKIAIARGGFLPHLPGSSVQRNYLPEAYSDFIFAIIVEEGGFFVGLAVIILYLILLYRAGIWAQRSDSIFCAILIIGIALMIVAQAFIHVGVSVDLGPVTGQPLPLISRGGSSILVNCAYFGLIFNITQQIAKSKPLPDQVIVDNTPENEVVSNPVDDNQAKEEAADSEKKENDIEIDEADDIEIKTY